MYFFGTFCMTSLSLDTPLVTFTSLIKNDMANIPHFWGSLSLILPCDTSYFVAHKIETMPFVEVASIVSQIRLKVNVYESFIYYGD